MIVLELHQIRKYYGDRLILDVDSLKIYTRDKIGLIGLNGAGKTTLLDIIAGKLPADSGHVKFYAPWAYMTQLDESVDLSSVDLSGGEKTLNKIENAFKENENLLIMADEPTSSLSIGHIERLTTQLKDFKGALVLISHDRALLNTVCNKIIEVENGRINEYTGNYDSYKREKDLSDRQMWQDYESYVKEKERLTEAVSHIKQKAKGMKKAPSRMGNSEARLHKNSIKARAKKVDGTSKAIEARLDMLDEVKKPVIASRTKIDIQEGKRIHSKLVIEAVGLTKRFGSRTLFENASFKIVTGSKTALIGENGIGKTTLIKMIMESHSLIKKSARLEIAYFSQDLSILDEGKTIYDNVAEDSMLSQTQIRNILSRMLFYRDDVFKKVAVLSGGERVKVALAKIFCRDVNMLILDEPNNYLDIHSMEALEGLIEDYSGTILLVTHDKSLIELADRLLIIEDGQIVSMNSSYSEYTARKNKRAAGQGNDQAKRVDENMIMQKELRLAEIIGRLSIPGKKAEEIERLDNEYKLLAAELRDLRASVN